MLILMAGNLISIEFILPVINDYFLAKSFSGVLSPAFPASGSMAFLLVCLTLISVVIYNIHSTSGIVRTIAITAIGYL